MKTDCKLLIHDYGGYSFSLQLAREFASRNYDVLYLYGEATQPVKRGILERLDSDPTNFQVEGISLSKPFQKYSLIKRRNQEIEYGNNLAKRVLEYSPDIVMSANTPLDTQAITLRASTKCGAKFIFWMQDFIGLATHKILEKKLPLFGSIIGHYYLGLESKLLRASDEVIVISEDFIPPLREWKINSEKIHLIHNWAVISDIPVGSKNNFWAIKHQLVDKFCFLYSGILGMKHNPEFLLALALKWRKIDSVRIVVISEGPGADWLIDKKTRLGLANLSIYNFQPYVDLPDILASADVLLALLAEDAGKFSVPSKVLTYLCAKKPLLAAIPSDNFAARLIQTNNLGIVVSPKFRDEFVNASENLFHDKHLRNYFSNNAYDYSRVSFDINKIFLEFEKALFTS